MTKTSTELLCIAMGKSIDWHSNYVFEAGCNYFEKLESYLPFRQELLHSKLVWGWWAEQWARRNENLVLELGIAEENALYPEMAGSTLRLFEDYHAEAIDPASLYPSRVLLEKSHAQMIGQLIDSKVGGAKC